MKLSATLQSIDKMQIGSLIQRAALYFADAPCLTEGQRTISFREFDELTNRLANSLLTMGLSPGDRVVIRGNERLQAGQDVTVMDS